MRVPLTTGLPSMTFGSSSIRCVHMAAGSESGCSHSTPFTREAADLVLDVPVEVGLAGTGGAGR